MQSAAEHGERAHTVEAKPNQPAIFKLTLSNGDVVCAIDRTTQPWQVVPISSTEIATITQLTLHNALTKLLPDTSVSALNLQTHRKQTSPESAQVYDVPVSGSVESELRTLAQKPDSRICIVPPRVLSRAQNEWHWQTLQRAFTHLYLETNDQNTSPIVTTISKDESAQQTVADKQWFVADELAALQNQFQQHQRQVVYDSQTGSFIFENGEATLAQDPQRYHRYELSTALDLLASSRSEMIPAVLREQQSADYWFKVAETLVRGLEQFEHKTPILKETAQHRLTLEMVDLLAQVVTDQELIQRLRRTLVMSRLCGYLWFRLAGGAAEATITGGGLAGGAGDIVAIFAIFTNTALIEFPQEMLSGRTEDQIKECLTEIIEHLNTTYAEEINTRLIPQLRRGWAADIAGAEQIYSDFAEVVVPAGEQTLALLANQRYGIAIGYLFAILTVKSMEKLMSNNRFKALKLQRVAKVLIKGLFNLSLSLIDQAADYLDKVNPITQNVTAVLNFVTNNMVRLSKRANNFEEIEASTAAVTELKQIVRTLRQRSINLKTPTQNELHTAEVRASLANKKVNLDLLPQPKTLFTAADTDLTQIETQETAVTKVNNNPQELTSVHARTSQPEQPSITYFETTQFMDGNSLLDARSKRLYELYTDKRMSGTLREEALIILFQPFMDDNKPEFSERYGEADILLAELIDNGNVPSVFRELVELYSADEIRSIHQQLEELLSQGKAPSEFAQRVLDVVLTVAARLRFKNIRKTFTGEPKPENLPKEVKFKKQYAIFDLLRQRGLLPESPAPVLACFELNQVLGTKVLLHETGFITQPDKVLFLQDFPELALEAIAGTVASTGTTFIHTSESDTNVQLDTDKASIKHISFNKNAPVSYFFDQDCEEKLAATKTSLKEYLQQLGFFSSEEIELFLAFRANLEHLLSENPKLKLKLQLAEALLSESKVLILENLFIADFSLQELQSIQKRLQTLAHTKVIICAVDSKNFKVRQLLASLVEENAVTVLQLNPETHAIEYPEPGLPELIATVKQFGVPYDQVYYQELLEGKKIDSRYIGPQELIETHNQTLAKLPAEQMATYSQLSFAPAFKSIDKLLDEVEKGETKLHNWTLAQVYDYINAQHCSVKLLLPELTEANKDRKIFVRVTNSVQVDVRYTRHKADGTSEELVLVEAKQVQVSAITGDAELNAQQERRNRERFNRLGVLEKYNASTEEPAAASIRGLQAEIGLNLQASQLQHQQTEAELKLSDTYGTASSIEFHHVKVDLTDEQFAQLTNGGATIINPQTDKTSTFGFIPVEKIPLYHQGKITGRDFVL